MVVPNKYYEMLSYEERICYDQIYSSIIAHSNCTISGARVEDVYTAYKLVTFDYPELIYHPGLLQRLQVTSNSINVLITYSTSDELEYNEALTKIIQKLWNKITYATSDYEKYKIIYDYLTSTIKYDEDVLDEYMEILSQKDNRGYIGNQFNAEDNEIAIKTVEFINAYSECFTPYGVIVKGRGVCMGIAKAYKVLCDYFGLPCICVEAKDKESNVEHLLNIVQLDGEYAFVDATYGLVCEALPMHNYDLFMVSRETIDKFYNLTYDFDCRNEELSYHSRNNLVFEEVADLRRYLEAFNAEFNDEIRARYVGALLDDKDLDDFVIEVIRYHLSSKKKIQDMAKTRNGFINMLLCDN